MTQKIQTIVLMSGGVESATLCGMLTKASTRFQPLFFNYAQRGFQMEYKSAEALADWCDAPAPLLVDLEAVGTQFQKKNGLHVPLPHRNLVLLSLAIGWATTLGASEIALGLNLDDFSKDQEFKAQNQPVGYETGTRKFVSDFTQLLSVVAPSLRLVLPQAEMTKRDVILQAVALGVPLDLTYSCMRGREKHCGTCIQCKNRKIAFAGAGVSEPADFYAA